MKFNKQFNSYIEEADIEKLAQQDPREIYGDEPEKTNEVSDAQNADNALREQGYKSLENALRSFYSYGYTGSSEADPAATSERVAEMLRNFEVDDRDIQRFTDALTSIILGQMVRGHADF